jgi:hypothetical protein
MGGIGGVVLAIGVLEDNDIEWIESMGMRLNILRWFFDSVCWCGACHTSSSIPSHPKLHPIHSLQVKRGVEMIRVDHG